MTIKEAKEIDLVDYLSSIGQQPLKINEFYYCYKSPLRDEKSSCFKVNRSLNGSSILEMENMAISLTLEFVTTNAVPVTFFTNWMGLAI
ncbi:MAG: hypothetical protein ABIN89_06295 [Chitinophagaceae bacterium]